MVLASHAAQTLQGRLLLAKMEQEREAQRAELINRAVQQLTQGAIQGAGVAAGAAKDYQQTQLANERWQQEMAFKRQQEANREQDRLAGRQLEARKVGNAEALASRQALAERAERAAVGSYDRQQGNMLAQAAGDPGARGALNFYSPPDKERAGLSALGEPGAQLSGAERAGLIEADRRAGADEARKDMGVRAQLVEANQKATKALAPSDPQYKELEGRKDNYTSTVQLSERVAKARPQDAAVFANMRGITARFNSPPLANWGVTKAGNFDGKIGGSALGIGVNVGIEKAESVGITQGGFDQAARAQQAADAYIEQQLELYRATGGKQGLSPEGKLLYDEVKNYNAKLVGQILKGQGPVTDRDVDRTSLIDIASSLDVVEGRLQQNANRAADNYKRYIDRLHGTYDEAGNLSSGLGLRLPETFLAPADGFQLDQRFGTYTVSGLPKGDPGRAAQMEAYLAALPPDQRFGINDAQNVDRFLFESGVLGPVLTPKVEGVGGRVPRPDPGKGAVEDMESLMETGANKMGELAPKAGEALGKAGGAMVKQAGEAVEQAGEAVAAPVKKNLKDLKNQVLGGPGGLEMYYESEAETNLDKALESQKERAAKSGRASKSGREKLSAGRRATLEAKTEELTKKYGGAGNTADLVRRMNDALQSKTLPDEERSEIMSDVEQLVEARRAVAHEISNELLNENTSDARRSELLKELNEALGPTYGRGRGGREKR
jgi:hypothetical protein